MASARGQGKKNPRPKSSPAHVAALIGGATLLLLLGVKFIGVLGSESGRELVARAGSTVQGWLGRVVTVGPPSEGVNEARGLEAALESMGIASEEIAREVLTQVGTGRRQGERWSVPVPRRLSLVQVNLAVSQAAPDLGLEVIDAWEESRSDGPVLHMELGQAGQVSHWLRFGRGGSSVTGLLAIVIAGYGMEWDQAAREFLEFPRPITFAVLPGYRGSRKIAEAARSRGFEVLLDLPMEPLNYPRVNPGPEAILVHHSPTQVRARIRKALRSVGEVSGIASYMGSRATTDAEIMRIVLDETRRRGLFFVDSGVAERSVTRDVAREIGTAHLVGDLFLDGDRARSSERIASRIDEAMRIAEETGEAVVFGHGYPETLAALTEALPEFARRGLRLVPVSRLTGAQTQVQTTRLGAESF